MTMITDIQVCGCNNGYKFREVDGYMVATVCECNIKTKNQEMINKSGLKNVLDKYTFDKYETKNQYQENIKALAQSYLAFKGGFDEKMWFYIGGQSGAGKTHICTAICGEIMKRNIGLKYIVANTEFAKIKANALDIEMYYKLITRLINVSVLYIDDLFKAKNITDADIKVLFEIINHRYNNDKVTIISSEKTIQDLESNDELEAITGRIIEKAGKYVVNLSKDSKKNYRKTQFLNI